LAPPAGRHRRHYAREFSDHDAHAQRSPRTRLWQRDHDTVPDNNMPFGGIKASGVGAYPVGRSAWQFYTVKHASYISAI
jgi:hypothetical protein